MAKLWLIQLPANSRGKRVVRRMLAEELADRHRPDPRVADRALVERAEERDAAVGVVFPAVLAVEDDRDERRRVVPAGVADGVQLAQEIVGGGRAGAALVVEADLVGHRVIAEDDRQLVLRPRATFQAR